MKVISDMYFVLESSIGTCKIMHLTTNINKYVATTKMLKNKIDHYSGIA